VPDTVQCIFEYPNNVRTIFASTLASSFSGAYTLVQGVHLSLLLREKRGWLIKEADAPDPGWLGYTIHESCFGETGYCIIAGSSELLKAGKEPAKEGSLEPKQEALYLALENFTRSIREGAKPACGPIEGYQATVAALKANDAVLSGSKIAYQSSWFDLKQA